MKEKFIRALKIILIIFGVLFLIQILLFGLIMMGVSSLASPKPIKFDFNFDKVQTSTKPKEMLPIIKYVEDYQLQNKKYPEKLENVKVKENLNYKYEVAKDGNCYTITIQEKNRTKKYQRCQISSDNTSSSSESYVEYNK